MAPPPLRIATRRSALARAQAFQVGRLLAEGCGRPFELVAMATTGDLEPQRAVADFDVKGLFVDTIRHAVAGGRCDLAVHSCKDLPVVPAEGLTLAAVPAREDPRDLLVTRAGHALATLPRLATVATSSQRRQVQLLRARPDLQVLAVRGNLDTRLRKVADGEFDAVVVAYAGLRRLYRDESEGGVGPLGLALAAVPLEPGECLPAPAQGALALECRTGDEATLAAVATVDDPGSHAAVRAERAFLARVGGGCLAPVGALATVSADRGADWGLALSGMIADPGRRRVLRQSEHGRAADPEALGEALARRMVAAGGRDILDAIAAARGASA